jgi:hypothetical protein
MVDVTDAPVRGAVKAVFYRYSTVVHTWGSGDGSTTDTAPAPTGVFDVLIPDGVDKIHVEVTPEAPFWPATQDVVVDITSNPPTIDYDGEQGLNTDLVAVHSLGDDFNLELPFVILQLQDATDTVNQKAAQVNARTGDYAHVDDDQQPISFDTPTVRRTRIGTPIVNGSGTKFALLNRTSQEIGFKGSLYFVERQTVPKLIAVVHPGWPPPESLEDQVKTPIPFHFFYPPPAPWVDAYPYGAKYLDFAYRYLIAPYSKGAQGMLYQNNGDSPKTVFVLPVPSATGVWVGDTASQSGLWRLLQEVSYFLQRKKGASWPLQEVGSISLSCFSAGADHLAAVLASGKGVEPDFLEQQVKNVFVFDGVPGDNAASPMRALCRSLAAWFQNTNGRTDRNLRVYTEQARWFDELQTYLALPASEPAVGGAREADSDTCTLAVLPMAFWMKIDDLYADWRWVHFSFPALFMDHAVTNSTF